MPTIIDWLNRDSLKINASGTSEGASKGWDTRGRGRKNDHAQALAKAGFAYRGKTRSEGGDMVHRYAKTAPNPKYDGGGGHGFGKNIDHNIWVHPDSGAWAHEAGYARTNWATGRGHGENAKSLSDYLTSGKYQTTTSHARAGSLWKSL